MKLYLLRHGIAEETGHGDPVRDRERRLTPEGAERVHEIARGLRRLGVKPEVILTSPLVRARQTADIVAEVLGLGDRLEETEHLGVPPDSTALVRQISKLRPRPDAVMLVGHEPHLSEFAALLIAGTTGAALAFKKGGLARLEAPVLEAGRCATLEWLLPPRVLRRLS
jgi:phosphohistidine phosphatase